MIAIIYHYFSEFFSIFPPIFFLYNESTFNYFQFIIVFIIIFIKTQKFQLC
jgi:hypothetical protein